MGNELSFHKMELRNDECLVQVEHIDPTEWENNQVAAAYLVREDSLLLWPQVAGLLKFPSLSFSLSVLPPIPCSHEVGSNFLLPPEHPLLFLCRSLWLSRLGNLFTRFILILRKLQVSILSVSWDDCL